MTMPEQALAGAAPAPASRTIWRDELIETIKLALPIALTQLGQVAMMTSDLAPARPARQSGRGRLGARARDFVRVLHRRHGRGLGRVTARPRRPTGRGGPRMVRRALRVGLVGGDAPRRAHDGLAQF